MPELAAGVVASRVRVDEHVIGNDEGQVQILVEALEFLKANSLNYSCIRVSMSRINKDFTLKVNDMAQQTTTKTFTLKIDPTLLNIITISLPDARVGAPYALQLHADGGVGPYAWAAAGLPSGLTCTPDGLISGTPVAGGLFSVVVTVVDSGAAPVA